MSWNIKSRIPLVVMVLSPLVAIPWISSMKNIMILISLTFLSTLFIRFERRASIIMSFIALTYAIITSYHGLGAALSVSLFAMGLILLGWIPKTGMLEASLWWLVISVPLAIILILYRLGSAESAYVMLLFIVIASTASYHINPPGIRSLLKGRASVGGSNVNLSDAGSKVFEIIFYILLIYTGVHINKPVAGIISLFISLVLRRFIQTKWSMLTASLLLFVFQYI